MISTDEHSAQSPLALHNTTRIDGIETFSSEVNGSNSSMNKTSPAPTPAKDGITMQELSIEAESTGPVNVLAPLSAGKKRILLFCFVSSHH